MGAPCIAAAIGGALIGRGGHAAFLRLPAGHLQVLVAQPHDGQNRPAAIGLDDRIHARVQPRAHQRLDAGQGKFLVGGIGQVNHLGHEVAGQDLVEILGVNCTGMALCAKKASVRGIIGPTSNVGYSSTPGRPGMLPSFKR